MASVAYKFENNEKLTDVASAYNITVEELMRINNIQPPFPTYVRQLPETVIKDDTIQVPLNANGGQSFETYWSNVDKNLGLNFLDVDVMQEFEVANVYHYDVRSTYREDIRPGRSRKDCYIIVGGTTAFFPCYPTSLSDSNQASYSSVSILGRSEPFQYYTGSGPRTVSVSFQFHSDMCEDVNYVYRITHLIESACYPDYESNIAATKCRLNIGHNTAITGIISNVNTSYSGPIIDDKFAVIDISFSVTEVTGNPPSRGLIVQIGGMR